MKMTKAHLEAVLRGETVHGSIMLSWQQKTPDTFEMSLVEGEVRIKFNDWRPKLDVLPVEGAVPGLQRGTLLELLAARPKGDLKMAVCRERQPQPAGTLTVRHVLMYDAARGVLVYTQDGREAPCPANLLEMDWRIEDVR